MKDDNENPIENFTERSEMHRTVDFINEAGMLRFTPRTGYQFLGSGKENVAEHSFRTAVIGYVLALRVKADPFKTMGLCLFHDFHEARTGDFNYVNKMYNCKKSRQAVEHATYGTGFSEQILTLHDEGEALQSTEAQLASDADQLDMLFNLKREKDLGNTYADKWAESAIKRLKTDEARTMAAVLWQVDHSSWWYDGIQQEWWESQKKDKE